MNDRNAAFDAHSWTPAAHIGALVMVSCILGLTIGGTGLGEPFGGTQRHWMALAMALTVAAALALIPLLSMFLLSLAVDATNKAVNVRRSFRDGLSAAWFVVLAGNWAIGMAPAIHR